MSTDVEEVNYDRLDKVIRRYAGIKSARQIADLTGYTPDEVIRRRNALVDSFDEVSIQEQRVFIVQDLLDMAREYKAKADRISIEDNDSARNLGPVLTAVTGALKAADQSLQKSKADLEKAEHSLNQRRIQELLDIVREAVYTSVATLAERHDIPESEMLDEFQGRLLEAAQRREIQ